MVWMSGHNGVVGNEKTIFLTRLGTETLFNGLESVVEIGTFKVINKDTI